MAHFSVDPVPWVILALSAESYRDGSSCILTGHTLARRTSDHRNTRRVTNGPDVPGTEGFPGMQDFSAKNKSQANGDALVTLSVPASLAPPGKFFLVLSVSPSNLVSISIL